MNKWLNKDVLITTIIGVLATVILVIAFRFFVTNNQAINDSESSKDSAVTPTPTSTTNNLEVYSNQELGVSFEYPEGLVIVTDGKQPTDQAVWLEIASISADQAKTDDYWRDNFAKLAIGELVSLPGDVFNKKTAISASAGEWPVSIYSELNSKNCQPNYNSKMIALVDKNIVIFTLHHNPSLIGEELKAFLATSTPESVDCQNKIVDSYNSDLFIEQLEKGFQGQTVLSGLNIFKTIISTLNITKTKAEVTSSSTPAYIDIPKANNGSLVLAIDELALLDGDEAITQMKQDNVCNEDCQVPAEGYLANNTKKFKDYQLADSALVVVKSVSSSTPAQLSRVSFPVLINFLNQSDKNKPPVFDVYFDQSGQVITGLKQR